MCQEQPDGGGEVLVSPGHHAPGPLAEEVGAPPFLERALVELSDRGVTGDG